ncbi:unnamed protein product [Arabis nemorensis]|uniref:Uncharacterized protein n=1 Tax=Arabis nemorensis TaxID=586526 RepID=A0A565C515_9BRAS|nr:unnamed protein product [Arabis nemorensis]
MLKKSIDKKTLLAELKKLGDLEKVHANLIRVLIGLTEDPEEKSMQEMSMESSKSLGRRFVTDILQQSQEEGHLATLVDEVKMSQKKVDMFMSFTKMGIDTLKTLL